MCFIPQYVGEEPPGNKEDDHTHMLSVEDDFANKSSHNVLKGAKVVLETSSTGRAGLKRKRYFARVHHG